MKKYKVLSVCLVFLLMALLMGLKRNEPDKLQSQSRFLMDTFCTIKAPGDISVLHAIEKAMDRMDEVDRKFNVLNPDSPLYGFNNHNIPVTDVEIVQLVRTALDISRKTGGKYDITIFPLMSEWGFFTDHPHEPSASRIDSLLKSVGYKNLRIENGVLTKSNPETMIDLGSIAKGYAVGEAVKVLKQSGITSALIDAGGDIYALGSYKGRPWKIGIKNPRGDGVIGELNVTDATVVTSGDYERFFEIEGKRRHHILDPSTGYPAQGAISATVLSSDAALADGWSTALFVMGAEKGIPVIEKEKSIQTMIMASDGKISYSSGMPNATLQLAKGR